MKQIAHLKVGLMEVFTFAFIPSRGGSMDDMQPFRLYTVSDSTNPIRVTGGLKIIPDYTFADVPSKGGCSPGDEDYSGDVGLDKKDDETG